MRFQVELPNALHYDTQQLIVKMAEALGEKLRRAEIKYGYTSGWSSPNWKEECIDDLMKHIVKGDPLDVIAFAAFCWHHNWSTNPEPTEA